MTVKEETKTIDEDTEYGLSQYAEDKSLEEDIDEWLELEQELAEVHYSVQEQKEDSQSRFQKALPDKKAVKAEITGIEKIENKFRSRVVIEARLVETGETTTFRMYWPRTVSGYEQSDLISLLDSHSIHPDHMADLRGEEVDVFPTEAGGYKLVVASNRCQRAIHKITSLGAKYGLLEYGNLLSYPKPTSEGWMLVPAVAFLLGLGLHSIAFSLPFATVFFGSIGALLVILGGIGLTVQLLWGVVLSIVYSSMAILDHINPF